MLKTSLLNDVDPSLKLHGKDLPETAACKEKIEGAARDICTVLVRGMAVTTIGASSGLDSVLGDRTGWKIAGV